MKQDLMIRLFRSMKESQNDNLTNVAKVIISEEKAKGHNRLSSRLQEILDSNLKEKSVKGELKTLFPSGLAIPTSKRHKLPLATSVEREYLRHEMILPDAVEFKFSRIEKEYVARERLALYGLKPKQKILLHGPPGCGKSMGAERIAWNIGLPFIKVRFEAVMSSYLGESANNLQNLFESVEDTPHVLLLDEFDFIAKKRSGTQDVGEMHRIVNTLLGLLEDFNSPGILVATTNLEGAIDPALFRRFDDIIEIPRPGKKEIKRLLQATLSSIDVEKGIDWSLVSKKMLGMSSALVAKTANNAAKNAIISNKKRVTSDHLLDSVSQMVDHLK